MQATPIDPQQAGAVSSSTGPDPSIGDPIAFWKSEQSRPFEGWDFSPLGKRLKFEPLPWDYLATARRLAQASQRLLDLGTGGGEVLERLAPLPKVCFATELVPERAEVARRRLSSHGVTVLTLDQTITLPFEDAAFDLVLTRNSAFVAKLIFPILAQDGVYFTQQVGRGNLRELLEEFSIADGNRDWKTPDEAVEELTRAGFAAVEMQSADVDVEFADVGALLYFLNAILPGRVDVQANSAALERLQTRLNSGQALRFQRKRYLVTARK